MRVKTARVLPGTVAGSAWLGLVLVCSNDTTLIGGAVALTVAVLWGDLRR